MIHHRGTENYMCITDLRNNITITDI